MGKKKNLLQAQDGDLLFHRTSFTSHCNKWCCSGPEEVTWEGCSWPCMISTVAKKIKDTCHQMECIPTPAFPMYYVKLSGKLQFEINCIRDWAEGFHTVFNTVDPNPTETTNTVNLFTNYIRWCLQYRRDVTFKEIINYTNSGQLVRRKAFLGWIKISTFQ